MKRTTAVKRTLAWVMVLILALSMNSAVFAETVAKPAAKVADGPIEVWNAYVTGNHKEENKLGTYNSLKEALAAAKDNSESTKLVYVRENYTLTEDIVIPENVLLDVYGRAEGEGYQGATLTVPAGRTLTVAENSKRLGIHDKCVLDVQSGGKVLVEGTSSSAGYVYIAPESAKYGKGILRGTLSTPAGKDVFRKSGYYWAEKKEVAVARITTADGSTVYCNSSSYIAPASGETLTLLKDVEATQTISSDNVVIDLNRCTWTGKGTSSAITFSRKTSDGLIKAVIKNGTVKAGTSTKNLIRVNGADVTIASDAVIDGGAKFGIVAEKNAVIKVEGTVKSTETFAISGNGTDNNLDNKTEITIKEPAVVSSEKAAAIYQPHFGVLKIEGGQITGKTGVEIRSGTLNMNGGKVTGSDAFQYQNNDNGITTQGAGIAVVQHVTKLPIHVTISGGTIEGSKALYEYNPNLQENFKDVKLSITGGTFNKTGTAADAASVYSENYEDFITGGTYNTILDTKYYDEAKYMQYKLDDKNLPGTVVPYTFEPEVTINKPDVSQGDPASVSQSTADAAAKDAKEAVKAILEGKTPQGISEEDAAKIRELLKDITSKDEVRVTITIYANKLDDNNVTANEKDLIHSLASGDEKAAAYLDFSVVMKVVRKAENGIETTEDNIQLTSVHTPLEFAIQVDPSLIKDQSVRIVRIHNGVPEILPTDQINREMGTIWMSTDKFSTYALLTSETVTVNFDTMGGTPVQPQTVRFHSAITRPEDPVRKGFTFAGWYTDKNYRLTYDFNTLVDSPFTLYAKWVKDEEAAAGSNGNQNGPQAGSSSQDEKNTPAQAVKTGDDTSLTGWFVTMLLAAIAASILFIRRHKKS
ncbi:MAG: InlB B-repeat-containing protein [Clostridiales Family XIII bacterium]|nr:InlB B-repeat-containing protein [Clostridia bacterium]MDY3011891.1 InlB B-repeat-containing protein [Clostridiales Family XIII bacterium]